MRTVVVVGVDSGSLEPAVGLLSAIPGDAGIAAVISAQISCDEERWLEEALEQRTSMRLAPAGAELGPGEIHLVPGDADARIEAGAVQLEPLPEDDRARSRPLDGLLTTVAASFGRRSAAVLFSNGAGDGDGGLAAVEAAGGCALVVPRIDDHAPPPPGADVGAVASALLDHARRRRRRPSIEIAFGDFARLSALERAIDELALAGREHEALRLWVPGCGDGFLAYLVAMLLRDRLEPTGSLAAARIFATDVDPASIARARTARYTELPRPLPGHWLNRYVSVRGGAYQLADRLRAMCVFAVHDLGHHPPFSDLHLIACGERPLFRQPNASADVGELLHFALRPGGLLVLPPELGELAPPTRFEPIDDAGLLRRARRARRRRPSAPMRARDLAARHREVVLEELGCASAVIDERGQIVDRSGPLELYLDGPATGSDLLSGSRAEIREALSELLLRRDRDAIRGVPLATSGDAWRLDIAVRPLVAEAPDERRVVVFSRHPAGSGEPWTSDELRQAIQGLESSNQDLQVANEELLSSREEVRRINESLEGLNTELQRKVGELEKLRHELDMLLATTPIPTVFVDADLRISWYSPSATELFRIIERDVGRPLGDIRPRFDAPSLAADMEAALASGHPRQLEVQRPADPETDAPERLYRAHLVPHGRRGDVPEGLALTFVDVTELEHALEQLAESEASHRRQRDELQTIYDTAPVGLAVFDPELRVTRGNAVFAELTGIEEGAAASALPEPLRVVIEVVFESGEPRIGVPRSIRVAGGAPRWWMCSVVPLAGRDGEIAQVSCVIEDVTDRVEREKRLRAASRHKDEFLAMLGHELRNPLAAIASANQLQRDSEPGEWDAVSRTGEVVARQVGHMTRLIDDLLDLSRIVRGKLQIDRASLDLAALLETEVADRHAALPEGLELEARVEGGVWIEGDRERLVQAIDNLIGNAIKFTPAPGKISVTLERRGEEAVVAVRDTGIGIERSLLDRMFEPFRQGRNDIARESAGLGLGLALAKKIARLHGGELVADSPGPGQGAEFRLELPAIDPPAQREPTKLAAPKGITVPQGALDIVLVEDNPDLADLLSSFLIRSGHQVRVVHTGAAGLAALEERPADVVLCDLGLPGELDGFGVARELQKRATRPRALIAVSGYGSEADVEAALRAGFDGHLTKPVDWGTLTRTIEARLRH